MNARLNDNNGDRVGANLEGANLSDATVTQEQLDQAKPLKGTTTPSSPPRPPRVHLPLGF